MILSYAEAQRAVERPRLHLVRIHAAMLILQILLLLRYIQ